MMKNTKKLFVCLLILTTISFAPIAGANTFKYALTQNDLPSGFVLVSSTGSKYSSSQSWKTPSNTTYRLYLTVNEFNDTATENNLWSVDTIIGHTTTFNGADKGFNDTSFIAGGTAYIYYAEKGLFIIKTSWVLTVYNTSTLMNEKVLMEAQLNKFTASSHSSPGFTSFIFLLSFGILGLVLSRRRKIN